MARYHGDPYWKQLVAEYIDAMERLYTNGSDIASDYLSSIACPTLIIHVEMDPMVDPVHARMLHRSIKRSDLIFFPGTGHEVQRERPETFNSNVLQFLTSPLECSGDTWKVFYPFDLCPKRASSICIFAITSSADE